ncbi:MAG: hypothetical protein A2X86_05940 [Bdellovibrionales bacterium GWA2_49_15]|nr:MAG: hypothetical protein A2X86_05940 [Bdellovibrionales bacterium GWA2_49_15]
MAIKQDNQEGLEEREALLGPKTILIVGISSFVGSNLAEFLKKDYVVYGTYHKTKPTISGVLSLPCDVLSREEIQLVLYTLRPHIVIYAAGLSSIEDCADAPDLADALNTVGLINVTEYCQRYKAQICYISSAFVFNGENRDYIEMDIPDSSTTYGKTVAASEFYIQKTSLNYIIFRCCRLYGRGHNPLYMNWFEKMQKAFHLGQNIQLDNLILTGYMDIYFLGMILKLAFEREVTNRLFQICTNDIMSIYDFGHLYASIFDENVSLLGKGRFNFPRISSVSNTGDEKSFKMDISNAEGFLNLKLPSIQDSLKLTFHRLHGEKKQYRKGTGITFI